MAFVDVNPRYRGLLARQGLVAPADFLDLHGVLVGGHADRNIERVTLGSGADIVAGYLKREQCVRWRDRFASAWGGFGFVSRSCREALLLRQLAPTTIDGPEMIAAGEDGRGRAFLLVREMPGTVDLRHFLRANEAGRHRAASWLGRSLAAIHAAGFTHPDLYSKHILVRCDGGSGAVTFAFLDWQRSRRLRRVPWARCWRDLAALHATLADDLATPRERLRCLRAYCRCRAPVAGRAALLSLVTLAARSIRRYAASLLRRRRLRELQQPPLGADCQQLVRLRGEAVCVTRQFDEELKGQLPEWLTLSARFGRHGDQVRQTLVPLSAARQAALVHRRVIRPLGWLWSWLRGKGLMSAEVEQAGTLFRLERYGIQTPRLLAFGQRSTKPWQVDSLLATEMLCNTLPPAAWLERRSGCSASCQRQCRHLVREAGKVVRRMHEAACYLGNNAASWAGALRVQVLADGSARVLVASVEAIHRRHRPSQRLALQDLTALRACVGAPCSRTDALRFLLAYLNVPRLTPDAKRRAGLVLRDSLFRLGPRRDIAGRTGA
jgi:hypothetical protein